MSIRSSGIAALAASLFVSSAFAQDIEPNQTKAEATAAGTIALTAGGTITGTTTGTDVTVGSTALTTVDTYRVRTTGYAPGGIYEHRLTITSSVVGHTGSIRGLNQTGTVGVGGTAGTTDLQIQTSVTAPDRRNQWYGFGNGEEIYYRVSGAAATTAGYTATLSTTTITPGVIAPTFESTGPITITTVGQTLTDTEIMLYDSLGNAIPGGLNDDRYLGPDTQSTLTRTLPAGTYYLGVATFELCSNEVGAADEDFFGQLTDFPSCVVLSSTVTGNDYDFQIQACNGTHTQPNTTVGTGPFNVTWWRFTTAPGAAAFGPAPANDNCGTATNVTTFPAAISGFLSGATNDGTGSLDATGKDVWYTVTNGLAVGIALNMNTCGTLGSDTALHVYNACGGGEIAANDSCGGAPCGGTAACLSNVPIAPSQTIKIRVSDKGLASCDFKLNLSIAPPANDECANPIIVSGTGNFPHSNLGATTGTQGQANAPCLFFGFTAVRQDVWYQWTASKSGAMTVSTCGLIATGQNQDTKIAVYNGTGCPSSTPIACNDDFTCAAPFSGLNATATFTAVCGNTYTFQIGMYGGTAATTFGQFSLNGTGPSCSTPTVTFCDGSAVGTTCVLCGNNGTAGRGCGNFNFNQGALLSSSGIASTTTDTLVLTCTEIPGPGLFFQANGVFGSPAQFGDGMLCAGVGIARMGVVFSVGGSASYPGGTTPFPISSFGANPGDTKYYQCWYRDSEATWCPTATFNTSNGISLVWQ